jgi:hypothetical protein
MGNARLASITLVLALAVPARAAAETCTDTPEVARIRAHLEAESRRAGTWNGLWPGVFITAAVGTLALAPQFDDDEGQRLSLYWSSAKSTIAAVAAIIKPLDVPTLPPCADEAQARAALERAARSERRGRHWMRHVESLALNAVGIGILGFGYGYWTDALVNTAVGLLVGEIRIFTQPTGSTRFTIDVTPVVVPETGTVGAGLLIRF